MDICTANNEFTIDVLKEISKNAAGENIVYSSMSIMISLAMVYLGAGGNTAADMSKALHFDEVENVHTQFQVLLKEMMKNENDYTLSIVNKLFGENKYNFLPSFLKAIKALYGAPLEKVDFSLNPEATRSYINSWIQQQTKGKIQNLLPENSISSNTALVVTNTLYFLANWTTPFRQQTTRKAPFTLITNEQIQVNMMATMNTFNMNRIEKLGMSVLELPYGDTKDLSMIILLPDNNTVLTKVEREISYEKLSKWTSENMRPNYIAVYLPRFRMEKSFSLKKVLSSLGMSSAFNQARANFSVMGRQQKLYVSDVHHKTFLEVNEKGTEAASATGSVMSMRSLAYEEFKANRPFHFFIRHNKSSCILLYGKFYKP
ncbi:leukocyte elastase inhibitor [Xenopus laevis]|uniref:Leukocyte elastase inhibitor n=2 Tax=Xenopus laevis TaxID=8355 RepID=A0A1L8FSA2_XENLA|nr:leukocyte elastase inhibitor [Xenopus laevis]OCT74466.1 hypothetical protein XELAEV_18033445mg [Xenopus laevis]